MIERINTVPSQGWKKYFLGKETFVSF